MCSGCSDGEGLPMRRAGGRSIDLGLALCAAAGGHLVLFLSPLLDSDVSYGVTPAPSSLQVELVANTLQAEAVGEVVEATTPIETQRIEEPVPDPKPLDLPEPPDPQPEHLVEDGTVAPHSTSAAKILPVLSSEPEEKPSEVVPSSPAPAPQTAKGNSDTDMSASDAGAEAAPLYMENSPPRYPEAARRRGIEGVVRLSVVVRADGTAGRVTLSQTSGSTLLDDAALDAVREWRFRPAVRQGASVDSTVVVPVRFRIERR